MIPSSQPFGAGEKDVEALISLALSNMVAKFNLEFLGKVDPKASTFLHFPIVGRGLVREGKPEVEAVTVQKLSPISIINVDSSSTCRGNYEMVDSSPTVEQTP